MHKSEAERVSKKAEGGTGTSIFSYMPDALSSTIAGATSLKTFIAHDKTIAV